MIRITSCLKNATGLHCQLYIFTIYDIPCNIIFDHTGGRSFIDNGFSETKDRLSHYARKRNKFLSFSSRLHGTSVWSVLVFTLNGLIFILIGLELPVIVHNLGNVSLTSAILYGLLVTFVRMGARVACALGASAFTSFISRFIKTADSRPGWKSPLVLDGPACGVWYLSLLLYRYRPIHLMAQLFPNET